MSGEAISTASQHGAIDRGAGLPDLDQLKRAYRGGEIVLQSSRVLWKHGAGKAGSKALAKTLGKAALPLAAVDAALSVRDAVVSHQRWKREELATQRLELEVQALEQRCAAEERHLARQLDLQSSQVDNDCAEIRLGLHKLDGAAAGRQVFAHRLEELRAAGAPPAKVAEAERQLDQMTDVLLTQLVVPVDRSEK